MIFIVFSVLIFTKFIRQNNASPSKDVHILISETSDYVTINGKKKKKREFRWYKELKLLIKLTLRGEYPELFGLVQHCASLLKSR